MRIHFQSKLKYNKKKKRSFCFFINYYRCKNTIKIFVVVNICVLIDMFTWYMKFLDAFSK